LIIFCRPDKGNSIGNYFYMLGKIYEKMGKKKEAGKNYERFLDL
jgi:hypothetical protein